MGRGRPPKADGERKAKDLRIPVTDAQKAIVTEAARLIGEEMAAWARPILLAAAQAVIDKAAARKKRSAPGVARGEPPATRL